MTQLRRQLTRKHLVYQQHYTSTHTHRYRHTHGHTCTSSSIHTVTGNFAYETVRLLDFTLFIHLYSYTMYSKNCMIAIDTAAVWIAGCLFLRWPEAKNAVGKVSQHVGELSSRRNSQHHVFTNLDGCQLLKTTGVKLSLSFLSYRLSPAPCFSQCSPIRGQPHKSSWRSEVVLCP